MPKVFKFFLLWLVIFSPVFATTYTLLWDANRKPEPVTLSPLMIEGSCDTKVSNAL